MDELEAVDVVVDEDGQAFRPFRYLLAFGSNVVPPVDSLRIHVYLSC